GPEDAIGADPERGLQQPHLAAFAAGAEHDRVFGGGGRFGVRCAGAARLLTAACDARRRANRERSEGPDREALCPRARRHETQLAGAPPGPRAAERELPRELVGEISGARGGRLQQRGYAQFSAAATPRSCGSCAAFTRALQRRAPMLGNSKVPG